LSGAWLDVARPDSLFLFFALAAIYLLRFHPSDWGVGASAIFLVLSFLAKQTALLVALPLAACCLVRLRGWRRFLFPVIVAAGLGLTTWWWNRQTGGWYAYYAFAVPRAHGIVPYRLVSFWVFDMAPLFLACVGAAALLLRFAVDRRGADLTFFAALAIGLVGAAWAVRLRDGSYTNTLLPACAGLALCFGPALRRLAPEGALDTPAADSASWVSAVLTMALAQFAVLAYNPLQQIPSADDRRAGAEFVAGLRCMPGDVYVPGHGYLPRLAGKKTSAHHVATTDVLREREDRLPNPLAEEIHRAFLTGRFHAVVVDDPAWFPEELLLRYDDSGPVFDGPDAFWPVTGRRIRPDRLYIRRDGP
jgi:hypothetical protein